MDLGNCLQLVEAKYRHIVARFAVAAPRCTAGIRHARHGGFCEVILTS